LSEIFVLIQLGIFLLKLGKKFMFCHWEHDRISGIKLTEKNPCIFSSQTFFTAHFSQNWLEEDHTNCSWLSQNECLTRSLIFSDYSILWLFCNTWHTLTYVC
jgi:hypothetical protein